MHLPILLPILLLSWVTADPKPLSDVFEVDTRNPSQYPNSCLRPEDPSKPNSLPLYDKHAPAGSTKNLLNNMYVHIYYATVNTLSQINTAGYNKAIPVSRSIRRLTRNLLGLMPRDSTGSTFEPAAGSLDFKKLKEARRRYSGLYRAVRDRLEDDQPDGEGKPKLFCGSDYMQFQTANSYALNKYGNKIPKGGKNAAHYKLKEWETKMGRDFDEFWYFWVNTGTLKGYQLMHPSTKQPSFCADQNHLGYMSSPVKPKSLEGAESWLADYQIILCPESFKETAYKKRGPDNGPKEIGAHLDNQATTAPTWYHELFHLVNPGNAPDNAVHFPKKVNGQRDPNWPTRKSSFDEARVPTAGSVYGAVQSMTLALYDLADPKTTDFDQLLAVRSAENLAWLSWGTMVTLLSGQDWATGTALEKGTKETAITASIPGNDEGRSL